MPRNRIPKKPICAALGCLKFNTALNKQLNMHLCNDHKKETAAFMAYRRNGEIWIIEKKV